MKFDFKHSSGSIKAACVAAVLEAATLIAFIIYGAAYSVYADWTVSLFLLLGIAGYAGYILLNGPVADALPFAAVICGGLGMNLCFLNSYPVWADWYGHFNMYGSQGGVTPVIIILVLAILSVVCGIVACFTRKEKEVA